MRRSRSRLVAEDRTPALHLAVRLLSARPYSERRLREKLRDRGCDEQEIAAAIVRLKEKKLLNDRAFAAEFICARCESHPRGRTALVRDLISRGISAALATDAVDDALSDEEEDRLARRLIERKAARYKSLAADVRQRRLASLLARRGFRPQTIRALLGSSMADTDTPGE